ncbi:MAG: YidH family protein [Nodosilinea sp.]
MDATPPQPLFGTTNELAKERNRAAAERTINAWIGQSLSLIGFGVAFDQIAQNLEQRFPTEDATKAAATSHLVGVFFVGVGTVVLVFALVQYRLATRILGREDYIQQSFRALNRMVVAAILLTGLAVMLATLFLL